MRFVTTRVVAGTLVIGTTGTFTTRSPMSVEVGVPSLAAVTLSGSGEISVNGIETPGLTMTLPGSGAIYASGTVTRLDVTLDGSGLAQLTNLVARDVHAVVTGSGLIRVTATASLNAAVPGSGAIFYGGSPPQVISPFAKEGFIDPHTYSFDSYLRFIEDVFLGGDRLNPNTDGRFDPRPDVRENLAGDLTRDFDFHMAPRPPMILNPCPKTTLVPANPGCTRSIALHANTWGDS